MCIGGYFGLEVCATGSHPHSNARLALKSGRASLRCLLEVERPDFVWLPYYSCDALLEPFIATGTPYGFFAVDREMRVANPWPQLRVNDRIVYINYFGLNAGYAERLEDHYGQQLWVDQTQAFFECPTVSRASHFNSSRKFFGVPDGSYLYAPAAVHLPPPGFYSRHSHYRVEHLFLREQGKVSEGHKEFTANELLCGGEIAAMSVLSEVILNSVDYAAAALRRRFNYGYLHNALAARNTLAPELMTLPDDAVPICYPYLPPQPIPLQHLWDKNIYVPCLWRECLTRATDGFDWEKKVSSELLPLPIDHRYGVDEMEQILNVIRFYAL